MNTIREYFWGTKKPDSNNKIEESKSVILNEENKNDELPLTQKMSNLYSNVIDIKNQSLQKIQEIPKHVKKLGNDTLTITSIAYKMALHDDPLIALGFNKSFVKESKKKLMELTNNDQEILEFGNSLSKFIASFFNHESASVKSLKNSLPSSFNNSMIITIITSLVKPVVFDLFYTMIVAQKKYNKELELSPSLFVLLRLLTVFDARLKYHSKNTLISDFSQKTHYTHTYKSFQAQVLFDQLLRETNLDVFFENVMPGLFVMLSYSGQSSFISAILLDIENNISQVLSSLLLIDTFPYIENIPSPNDYIEQISEVMENKEIAEWAQVIRNSTKNQSRFKCPLMIFKYYHNKFCDDYTICTTLLKNLPIVLNSDNDLFKIIQINFQKHVYHLLEYIVTQMNKTFVDYFKLTDHTLTITTTFKDPPPFNSLSEFFDKERITKGFDTIESLNKKYRDTFDTESPVHSLIKKGAIGVMNILDCEMEGLLSEKKTPLQLRPALMFAIKKIVLDVPGKLFTSLLKNFIEKYCPLFVPMIEQLIQTSFYKLFYKMQKHHKEKKSCIGAVLSHLSKNDDFVTTLLLQFSNKQKIQKEISDTKKSLNSYFNEMIDEIHRYSNSDSSYFKMRVLANRTIFSFLGVDINALEKLKNKHINWTDYTYPQNRIKAIQLLEDFEIEVPESLKNGKELFKNILNEKELTLVSEYCSKEQWLFFNDFIENEALYKTNIFEKIHLDLASEFPDEVKILSEDKNNHLWRLSTIKYFYNLLQESLPEKYRENYRYYIFDHITSISDLFFDTHDIFNALKLILPKILISNIGSLESHFFEIPLTNVLSDILGPILKIHSEREGNYTKLKNSLPIDPQPILSFFSTSIIRLFTGSTQCPWMIKIIQEQFPHLEEWITLFAKDLTYLNEDTQNLLAYYLESISVKLLLDSIEKSKNENTIEWLQNLLNAFIQYIQAENHQEKPLLEFLGIKSSKDFDFLGLSEENASVLYDVLVQILREFHSHHFDFLPNTELRKKTEKKVYSIYQVQSLPIIKKIVQRILKHPSKFLTQFDIPFFNMASGDISLTLDALTSYLNITLPKEFKKSIVDLFESKKLTFPKELPSLTESYAMHLVYKMLSLLPNLEEKEDLLNNNKNVEPRSFQELWQIFFPDLSKTSNELIKLSSHLREKTSISTLNLNAFVEMSLTPTAIRKMATPFLKAINDKLNESIGKKTTNKEEQQWHRDIGKYLIRAAFSAYPSPTHAAVIHIVKTAKIEDWVAEIIGATFSQVIQDKNVISPILGQLASDVFSENVTIDDKHVTEQFQKESAVFIKTLFYAPLRILAQSIKKEIEKAAKKLNVPKGVVDGMIKMVYKLLRKLFIVRLYHYVMDQLLENIIKRVVKKSKLPVAEDLNDLVLEMHKKLDNKILEPFLKVVDQGINLLAEEIK